MDTLLFGAFWAVLIVLVGYKMFIQPKPPARSHRESKTSLRQPQIEPLRSFDWQSTQPLKFRPFKPIYHMTMALQSTPPSDLIIIDSNYKDRILQRRDLIRRHASTVMGATPQGGDAVRELYSFLVGDYLPTRYPTIFTLDKDSDTMRNHIAEKAIPTCPPDDSLTSFRILGETVEDDMFLLQETADGHRLVAFVCCFPSGFDPSSKLGKVLKDIHDPVPAYEKIGASMERFFSRLEVGKSVRRTNWSVSLQSELFTPQVHSDYDNEPVDEDGEFDIEAARLRIELQSLTRLPNTRAILFSFKTYLYPIRDVKDEGLGPQFADAIEGLKLGNAPGMFNYKGGQHWGKGVCEYLKS